MEYADGGTLADWFEKQPGHENGLPLETLLPIFRPLAEALDLAHRNGILHRDVKPQNIMFMGREKTPVLIDFGIAARIRPENVTSHTQSFSRTDTMAHSSSGTPRYMAPEQMEGKPQNGRTDQYALAMVLYEMLVGSLPFSGNSASILLQKLHFTPQFSDLSPSAGSAFVRALAFEAKDRFAACADFMDALKIQILPASPIPEPSKEKSVEEYAQKNSGKLYSEDPADCLWEEAERKVQECFMRELAEEWTQETETQEEDQRSETRRNFLLGGLIVPAAAALGLYITSRADSSSKPSGLAELEPCGRLPRGTYAGERKVWEADGVLYPFRWCPPGTFTMGSPAEELGRFDSEIPHEVTLTRGFWMLETEVTHGMWKSVMGVGIQNLEDEEPVVKVDWNDCRRFCEKLSSKLEMEVSLPTEAQWEYACRAGTTGAYAGRLGKMGWYGGRDGNSGGSSHPVGEKKPNAWGLYDMHGNVREWCSDWYAPYMNASASDPTGPDLGTSRVVRGGGWQYDEGFCRSAYRHCHASGEAYRDLGFRCVLALPVK